MDCKILIAEDDGPYRIFLKELLELSNYDVETVGDGEEAIGKVQDADLLLTDLDMPGMDGLRLLCESLRRRPGLQVIVLTGHASIDSAVEAIRRGARTYLTKPIVPEILLSHVRGVEKLLAVRKAATWGRRSDLVGCSIKINAVYTEIDKAALLDIPVLITGETGTGKGLAARAIHDQSHRAEGPFITVDLVKALLVWQ